MANQDIIKKIAENFSNFNKVLENQLYMSSTHEGLTGSAREDFWEDFLNRLIPEKYTVVKGVIVMDTEGKFSKEIDIAVIDRQYTPYIFNYGTVKFIPIEAVSIVVQCKSKTVKTKLLQEWSKSISDLIPNPSGITRMVSGLVDGIAGFKTKPIFIMASMDDAFTKKRADYLSNEFDIFLSFESQEDGTFKIISQIPNEEKNLNWWSKKLTGIERTKNSEKFDQFCIKDLEIQDNSFLSLNFQLNQLLMLINNPMLFPHYAYATLFKKHFEEKEDTNALKTNPNSRNKRKAAQKRRRV